MKFGAIPIAQALGSTAAHSIRTKERMLRKGTRITEADIVALRSAGILEIVAATLEPNDISEDEAANMLAVAVAGKNVHVEAAFTGRSNLHAEIAGVLLVDREGVDRLNRVDEAVTFATLPAFKPVCAGEMIGTIKIIPFAVAAEVHHAAMEAAKPLLSVAPYQLKRVAVISTMLPGLAEKVIDKTMRVTANRLAPTGAMISSEDRKSVV